MSSTNPHHLTTATSDGYSEMEYDFLGRVIAVASYGGNGVQLTSGLI
jgi:hypothetical protein